MDLSERELAVLRLLGDRAASANWVGTVLHRRGLVKKRVGGSGNYCLPGSAVLNALDRKGLVSTFMSSPDCRWASRLWCLTHKGREELARLNANK